MRRLFIFICLCFISCSTNTKDSVSYSIHSFIDKPNPKWTHIKAKQLNDTEKAQKVNLLGKCYYLEDEETCDTILETFKKECDLGVGLSCGMLSITSRDARGVSRDPQQTLMYVRQGCYFNDELSCMYMRQYYLKDNKIQEADSILKYTQSQCNNGDVFACLLLSLVYENDESFIKQKNYILPYRKMACDKNFAIACAYMDSKEIDKQDYENYQAKACISADSNI